LDFSTISYEFSKLAEKEMEKGYWFFTNRPL
jgi:hypothetical protein